MSELMPPAAVAATPKRGLSRHPAVRWGIWILVLILLAVMPFIADDYQLAIGVAILLAVIGSIGTNLIVGVADQASIGNAAFLAIGAFTAALLSITVHLTPVLTVVIAGLMAAAIGLIVAIPAVRVRGLYLIIATLALNYIVIYAFTRLQSATVGIGGYNVEQIRFPGLSLQQGWFYIAGICALIAIVIMRNLLRSRFGRAWFAISRDEVASRALGVNLFGQKLAVFGVSSFLLGLQGGLYAYYVGVVSSDQFTFELAVSFVAMVVVGGLGTVAGSILGAVFVIGLPYLVNWIATFLPSEVSSLLSTRLFAVQTLLYGVAIVGFIMFEPRGLVYTAQRVWGALRRLLLRMRGKQVVSPVVVPAATTAAVARPAAREIADPVLRVRDLQVTYNRLSVAIDGIDVAVGAGEIVVMLGANGAGKTTTLRGISGFLPGENARVTAGDVELDGVRVSGRQPFELAKRGMVLVPERDKVFKTLTVTENMAVVPTRPGGDRAAMTELIESVFPALGPLRDRQAGYLSGGERQMLAIAKALISDPRVLLVDELSLGIAPFLVTRMMTALDEIRRAHDVSILLVEQNAPAALAIADYAYVLQTGRVVLQGSGRDLARDDEVRRLYLGGTEQGTYGRLETREADR